MTSKAVKLYECTAMKFVNAVQILVPDIFRCVCNSAERLLKLLLPSICFSLRLSVSLPLYLSFCLPISIRLSGHPFVYRLSILSTATLFLDMKNSRTAKRNFMKFDIGSSKNLSTHSSSVNIGQKQRTFYMKTHMHIQIDKYL
jgi:hypothetical protein